MIPSSTGSPLKVTRPVISCRAGPDVPPQPLTAARINTQAYVRKVFMIDYRAGAGGARQPTRGARAPAVGSHRTRADGLKSWSSKTGPAFDATRVRVPPNRGCYPPGGADARGIIKNF